jgi:glutathione S-transferase
MVELLHLSYSPWSEKARWALERRGVAYRGRHYQPMIGELELRLRLRRLRGKVSVPFLRADGEVAGDSFEIARYAEAHGSGPSLFPAGKEREIERYNELSERGLSAGRALALARVLDNDEALIELVPRGLRKRLGKLAPGIGAFGVRRTLRKYGGTASDMAEHERVLVEVLDTMRRELGPDAASEPKTLLGTFSYADIAMAQVLAFVMPPASGLRLGKGNRSAFGNEPIAARYPDLLAWRDALYLRYRSSV